MDRPFTAEQYRNIFAAETALAKMDFQSDLAELHDTEPCERLRRKFAELYRKAVGVHPSARERFRTGLAHLAETGAMPVEDLISRLQSEKVFDSGAGKD